MRTLKFLTLGRSLTSIPPSWIILHHQQIKILWSVKGFSVVQEERIESSGVENSRKRIIKSNHVENHVEKTFKRRLQSGYFRFTRWYYGVYTGLRTMKIVRMIIKDGYLDMLDTKNSF